MRYTQQSTIVNTSVSDCWDSLSIKADNEIQNKNEPTVSMQQPRNVFA